MQPHVRPHQIVADHHRSVLVAEPIGRVTGQGVGSFFTHNSRPLSPPARRVNGQQVETGKARRAACVETRPVDQAVP